MLAVLSDIHARLIGEATGPVTISPNLVAQAAGIPVAAQIPPVTVDVPTYDILDTSRRTLREGIPLTQGELADRAGIGRVTLTRIETGDIVVAIGDRQHLDELGRLANREPRPGQAGP